MKIGRTTTISPSTS